jgi:hypothetical protein
MMTEKEIVVTVVEKTKLGWVIVGDTHNAPVRTRAQVDRLAGKCGFTHTASVWRDGVPARCNRT